MRAELAKELERIAEEAEAARIQFETLLMKREQRKNELEAYARGEVYVKLKKADGPFNS